MRKALKFALLFVLFSILLPSTTFAQASTTTQAQTSASDDLSKLLQKMDQMKEESRRARESYQRMNAAEKNAHAEEMKVAQAQFDAQMSAMNKQVEILQKNLEATGREAQIYRDNQLRTIRIVWYVSKGAVLIGILVLVYFLLFRKKSKKSAVLERLPEKPEIQKQPETSASTKLLVNPNQKDLEEFSVSHGGIQKMPIILRVKDPTNGNLLGEVFCYAELKPGGKPVVWFNERPKPASWIKSMLIAKEILSPSMQEVHQS